MEWLLLVCLVTYVTGWFLQDKSNSTRKARTAQHVMFAATVALALFAVRDSESLGQFVALIAIPLTFAMIATLIAQLLSKATKPL